MARIRTIKPEFWNDEKLAEVSRLVRLTAIGIISKMCDDEGRFRALPRVIKGECFPLDDDVTAKEMTEHLVELARVRFIVIYEHNKEKFGVVRNWKLHQKIDRPTASRLPAPPPGWDSADASTVTQAKAPDPPPNPNSSSPRRVLDEPSTSPRDRTERNGTESKGVERSGDGSARETPSTVMRFLDEFYPATTALERRKDVMWQLSAVLKPQGAKVSKGVVVRANGREHLNKVLSDVMRSPPRDRDKAIVIVLKALGSAELDAKGRTPSEAAAAEDKDTDKALELYGTLRKRAIERWARANPDELEALEKLCRRTADSEIAFTLMLTQKAASAAGFPDADTWLENRRRQVPA